MREIVFDTETTSLDPAGGDRLIEIGCVELLNLSTHPGFEAVVDEFADFVGDSILVAHNAAFDRAFINMELTRCTRAVFAEHRFVDTLLLARRRHPNGPNSLDALCARYRIDNSSRTKHGAPLDAQILAEVYLELLGGPQSSLALVAA